MKKAIRIVNISTLLLLPLQVHADLQNGWLDNWLLGVSTGYAARSSVIGSSIIDLGNLSAYSRQSSDNGWLVAGFLGYQAIRCQWLLGTEFNLEWQNIDNTHFYAFSGRRVTADYRRKGMLDLSGRVGYAFTPNFMPYVRLGAEISRDSLASMFEGRFIPDANLYNKAWIHRFLLGIGVEAPIPGTCGKTIRLEYNYHSKGKTIEDFGATGAGDTMIEYYTAMQPKTYSGRVSLVWNLFDDY